MKSTKGRRQRMGRSKFEGVKTNKCVRDLKQNSRNIMNPKKNTHTHTNGIEKLLKMKM